MCGPGGTETGRFWLIALGALWGLGPATPAAIAEPDRPVDQRALLIAVQKYNDPRLNLTVTLQDSNALKKTLTERAGIPLRNLMLMNDDTPPEFRPTLANIRRELRDFLEAAGPTDRLLIYFSGHGYIHEGQTFLVPTDVDVKEIAKTALPAQEVREALTRCKAAVKFLVLDCCQAGGDKAITDPSIVAPQLVAKGLELERVPGCVVLASCQAQEKSYEWPERRQSVFTYWLCKALEGGADKDADGKISADEVYEYTYERTTKTVSQMLGERSQTPVRQIGVGVVGVTDVMSLLPESPESLCARLAAHLDLEVRLRKLKKIGVLEFLEPYGQVEGLAKSSLPAYCTKRVREELTRLAGSSFQVLDGPQFRKLVRGMPITDVGDPRAMQRLAQQGGDLDAVISGTLKRRGSTMALACEMIATRSGDTLASPSGKLPLTETLIADDGFSFDNRRRVDGSPYEARVVEAVLDQARAEHPLLKSDFPFRVEIYSIQPAPGEAIGPGTRRVKKPFVTQSRDRPDANPNDLSIVARSNELFEVRISNGTEKRIGCALLIDGINSLGQRRERLENARPWVLEPRKTYAFKDWTLPEGSESADEAEIGVIKRQFIFTDLAHSVAGRLQFGDAIGTITAAFFEEDATRGVGEGQETRGRLKTVKFNPGRLLGAINIKYVDEDALRAPQAPR